jgi:hypothetical protein
VTGSILLGRSHIEYGDLALLHPAPELVALDGLHRTPGVQILTRNLVDLRESRLGEPTQREEELADLVVREPVLDVEPPFLCIDLSSRAEHLQVLGRVCDRDAGQLGQRLHGTRPLTQEVEELEPLRSRDGFPNPRELLVDRILEPPVGRRHALQVFNWILE